MESSNAASKYGLRLFLRSIGVESPYNPKLEDELSDYISDSFSRLGCCVLWYKSLTDTKSALFKILKKYSIEPTYDKFSIIINKESVLHSPKMGCTPKLVYQVSGSGVTYRKRRSFY
jgi:hypothetical protein